MDPNIFRAVSLLIKRHVQVENVIQSMEEMGISVHAVDDLLGNFFEIELVVSLMHPKFQKGDEFLPNVLHDICGKVYKSNLTDKSRVVISMFDDILDFFKSGYEHGSLSKSDHNGTVYYNKEGEKLDFKTLSNKHGAYTL